MSKPGGTSASNIDQLLDRSAPTLSVRPEPGIRLPAPGGSINPSVMLPHFRRGAWAPPWSHMPMPPASACRDAAPASVTGPTRRRYVGRITQTSPAAKVNADWWRMASEHRLLNDQREVLLAPIFTQRIGPHFGVSGVF